jgi:hypothetical protein
MAEFALSAELDVLLQCLNRTGRRRIGDLLQLFKPPVKADTAIDPHPISVRCLDRSSIT